MSQHETTTTVAEVIGQNMRRLREDHGSVLADVSRAARDLGLTWDGSAVSRIETGKRALTLEEFLALPLVMTVAINEVVTMAGLLDGLKDIGGLDSFSRRVSGLQVLTMLAEPGLIAFEMGAAHHVGEGLRELLEGDKRRIQADRARTDERSAYRELEAVADELDVKVNDVMKAADALWGEHTLTPSRERERRLLASGADLSQPKKVRTLRGHLTRQLMSELREYFDARSNDRKGHDDGAST